MDLGDTFDRVAELYDRARPGYPKELFDDLIALTGIPAGGRVLEIGAGTGQATLPMARRGYRIVALEPGKHLAAVACRNLAAFSTAEVQVARFEDWPVPTEPFDVVLAATAFHWVDPKVRVQKAWLALKPSGSLAIISTDHVAGGDMAFFEEVQDCYERFMPDADPGQRLPELEAVEDDEAGVAGSGLFEEPAFRRYPMLRLYTTESYLEVLNTYSNHIALEPQCREGLFRCISELIETRYGGRIRKAYLRTLLVARKAGALSASEGPARG